MSTSAFHKGKVAFPLVAMLALAGCGGGGKGGMSMDTGGPGTGGGPGMGEPRGVPVAAPVAPTLAELIPDPANTFGVLSKSLHFDYNADKAFVSNRFSISSVASDGDNGFHVTYVIDGAEETVHFSKADFATRDSTSYTKDVGGRQYWLWSGAGSFDGANYGIGTEFSYFDGLGSHHPSGGRILSTYGSPTGSGGMPAGTASYTGWMYAEAFDNTVGSTRTSVARSRLRGSLVLTADFADAVVEGRIFRLNVQHPGVNYDDREFLPSTTRFDIANGAITGDGFTADLTGVDDVANAPLGDSVRGFTGDVSGQFYGPNAREFGAALSASRATDATDDWAMVGYLVGTRADVVGQHADNEPLQAGVNRLDYSSASPRAVAQDANNRVTAITANADSGYTIDYMVDGTPQTISLSVDDLGAGSRSEAYSKRSGTHGVFFRRPYYQDRVPQGLHYNVKDWSVGVYPDGTSTSLESAIWASVVHGTRTASASMPQTGTATYAGRAASYVFTPSPGEGRASPTYAEGYSGSLTLSADFGAGSISGRIFDLEHSPAYFTTSTYQAVPGEEFSITNGMIEGNALSGSLSGLGYSGTVSGAFYGPAVDEAAGVMQATSAADGKLLHGWFGGARQ